MTARRGKPLVIKKRPRITVDLIDPELKTWLAQTAKKDKRSPTEFVRIMLERAREAA